MLKQVLILLIAFAFISGCTKKDEKKETSEQKKDEKKEFVFTSGFYCKIEGKDFVVPDAYAKKDEKSFTIYAKLEVEKGQYDDFFIFVETPIKTGEFALSRENKPGHVQYNTNKDKPKGSSDYDAYWSEGGKLVLTKVDDKSLEGTFEFTASAATDDGTPKTIKITNGKIKVSIK